MYLGWPRFGDFVRDSAVGVVPAATFAFDVDSAAVSAAASRLKSTGPPKTAPSFATAANPSPQVSLRLDRSADNNSCPVSTPSRLASSMITNPFESKVLLCTSGPPAGCSTSSSFNFCCAASLLVVVDWVP